MKKLFITTLCLATAASSLAAELEYTYNVNNDDPLVYGFNKKETYDVAILLNDPSLVGAKVTGMKVLLPVDASSVDNLSSWMTSELTLDGKNNAPDICSVEASYSEYYLSDHQVDISFFVYTVFYLTFFDILNRFRYIHCNGSGFRIRH